MTRTAFKSDTRLLPASGADDDARWAAVVARDRAYDGAFYVCVASTGIYCRNTCAARLNASSQLP